MECNILLAKGQKEHSKDKVNYSTRLKCDEKLKFSKELPAALLWHFFLILLLELVLG